jgi:hypothetical protein
MVTILRGKIAKGVTIEKYQIKWASFKREWKMLKLWVWDRNGAQLIVGQVGYIEVQTVS